MYAIQGIQKNLWHNQVKRKPESDRKIKDAGGNDL
jgi:hypothetical protein